MKRLMLSAMLILALVFTASCGSSDDGDKAATDGGLKTGFAVLSSVDKSTPAGKEDGLAQTDSTAVGVLVDGDGVIVKCVIDAVQTQINFGKDGKIITPLDTKVPTKIELGDEYGMHKASSIKKDWADQIKAFCDYVEGKTLDEVKGIALTKEGTPADEDLSTSVTIHIGDYVAGLEKAVASAKDMGAKSGDTLGLGIETNIAKSADFTADAEGVAQAYSIYTLASFDKEGVITSSIIDGSQCNVNFDATGKITSDLKAELKTKNQLGEAYGMKKASSIGKEWNEQATAFAEYAVGKTAKEVSGVAVKEGVPTDEDLAASVTVHVTDFTAGLTKAAATAK